MAKQLNIIRTLRPAQTHLHLPEPARGGQDCGPGQDHCFLPRHGTTSKIQRGNQSAGISQVCRQLYTQLLIAAGVGQPGKLLPTDHTHPTVGAPCLALQPQGHPALQVSLPVRGLTPNPIPRCQLVATAPLTPLTSIPARSALPAGRVRPPC